jgi:hypothetical protein
MKKLIVISAVALTGISAMGAHAYAQQSQAGSAPVVEKTTNERLAGETIDNIIVPFDVLTAIQMYFEGYAVTHVDQVQRNGQPAYRLQVDRDDVNNNADSFYLVFDSKWDYLGREAYVAPKPPAPAPVEKPKDDDKREEEKPEKPDKPDEAQDGGQGGDDDSETDDEGDSGNGESGGEEQPLEPTDP